VSWLTWLVRSSHRGGPYLFPRYSMWDLRWRRCHWDRLFFEPYFDFSVWIIITSLTHIHLFITWELDNGPIRVCCLRSWVSLHSKKPISISSWPKILLYYFILFCFIVDCIVSVFLKWWNARHWRYRFHLKWLHILCRYAGLRIQIFCPFTTHCLRLKRLTRTDFIYIYQKFLPHKQITCKWKGVD
jgi:hypothetical protein